MIPDIKFDEIISHYDSPGDHDFCRPGWHIPTEAEMNDYNPSVSVYPSCRVNSFSVRRLKDF